MVAVVIWRMVRIHAEGVSWVDRTSPVVTNVELLDAFDRLTRRDVDRAYRLAWAILRNEEDAAEATQDALTSAWQRRRSLRDPDKLEAWLSRILVDKCRDRLRSRGRSTGRVRSIETVSLPAVPDGSRATADRDELGRALGSLNPDQRIVVVLRFWADLTVDGIADRLGVPPGTVKTRLHDSLRVLRSTLEEHR
jgi:RNA polymerase sigma factor (sigma-70 family)